MELKDIVTHIISILAVLIPVLMYNNQQRAELMQRVAKVEATVDLILKVVGMYADKLLHHPITPIIDRFIDKDKEYGNVLTHEEAVEFANLLQDIADNDDDKGVRAMAALRLAKLVVDYDLKFIVDEGTKAKGSTSSNSKELGVQH